MTQRVFVGNQNLQEVMESLVSTIFEAKKTDAGDNNASTYHDILKSLTLEE